MSSSKIAKAAGVSKATVSRVLNNSKKVSPETRDKVLEVIQSLGVQPRTRSKKKPIRTVLILIAERDLFMEYSPARWRMIYSIQQVLTKHHILFYIYQAQQETDLPQDITNGLDGVIIMGGGSHKEFHNKVSDIPSIWINSMGSVDKDMALARNQLVGQIAAQYLISKGHKTLAFFKVLMNHPAIETDGDFFEFTATKSGCHVSVVEGTPHFSHEDETVVWEDLYLSVRKAIKKIASMRPRPTGLFVPLGPIMNKCYEFLRQENIHPGQDIEIVSCGCEHAMLASLSPKPANISINVETIGQRAAEQLLRKMNSSEDIAPVNITVIPTLETEE